MELMLDKKQIQAIILFKFKMDHKAAEKTCNINNAFGPGTANEHTVEWWFKKFCKGDECLEDEECSGSSWEVDNDQLRWSLRLILLQIHEKLLKNSVSTILWFFSIWRKLERWKNLVNGCLVSWPKIKIVVLKCCLLLFYATIDHFSIGLWCATKGGFYSTNTGDDQLSGWTGKKIQSISQCQTYTKKKKRLWSLFGDLLSIWSTTAFWILVKPLHLRSMFSK